MAAAATLTMTGLFRGPAPPAEPANNAATFISALLPLTTHLPVSDFKKQNIENFILEQKTRPDGAAARSTVKYQDGGAERAKMAASNRAERVPTAGRHTITSMIRKGYFNLVRYLLDSGAQVNYVNPKDEPSGRTALIYCVFIKEDKWAVNVAQTLIEYGASLRQTDAHGLNVFHYCCAYGRSTLLEFLLNSLDFDLTQVVDDKGNTCLHYAMWNRDVALVRLLLTSLKAKHFYDYDLEKIELRNKLGLKPSELEEVSLDSPTGRATTARHATGVDSLDECKKYLREFTAVVQREQRLRQERERHEKLLLKQQMLASRKRLSKIKISDQVSVRKVNPGGKNSAMAVGNRKTSKASSTDSTSVRKKSQKLSSKAEENVNEDVIGDFVNEDDVFHDVFRDELTTIASSSTTAEYVDYVKPLKSPVTPTSAKPPTTPLFKTELRDLMTEHAQHGRAKSSSKSSSKAAHSPPVKSPERVVENSRAASVVFAAMAANKAVRTFKESLAKNNGTRSLVMDAAARPVSARLLGQRPKTAPIALTNSFGVVDKDKVRQLTKKSFNLLSPREFQSSMIAYNDLFFAREHMLQAALVNAELRSSAAQQQQNPSRALSSKSTRAKSALFMSSVGFSNQSNDYLALLSSATASGNVSPAAQGAGAADEVTFDSDKISETPLHAADRERYHDHYSRRKRGLGAVRLQRTAETAKSRLGKINSDWKDDLGVMYKALETSLTPSYRKTIKPPVSTKVIRPLGANEQTAASKVSAPPSSRKMSSLKRGSLMSSTSSLSTHNVYGGIERSDPHSTTSISDSLSMRKKS